MARRSRSAALAVFSLLVTPAGLCAPVDDAPPPGPTTCLADLPPPADGEPALVVGQGDDATFVPLSSGATLTLFEGAQGGAHVNVSLRGFAPETDPDGSYYYEMSYTGGGSGSVPFRGDCAGQWQESDTQRLFLDQIGPSSGTLTVRLVEEGASTPLASAEVDVVVVEP